MSGLEARGASGGSGAAAVGSAPAGAGAAAPRRPKRWLVALDIDGTVMREDGVVTQTVIDAVQAATAAGHDVMLATGRSERMTVPVLDTLGITPRYVVCANGAITLERDDAEPTGYRRIHIETFDPTEVLQTVRGALGGAAYGVEEPDGHYLLSGEFPSDTMTMHGEQVPFERLLGVMASRVVVISPEHGLDEFLEIVEQMGLHKVSYNVGWTAWLDIAPEGVTKATALERVREWLDIPRSRVFAAGDGRNDIDMLRWASTSGRGIAMGQAPEDVIESASELTTAVEEDGLAPALDTLPR
jgi:5-amino-6-(5-phospho-D-ribitylamino)uracil phosphatase